MSSRPSTAAALRKALEGRVEEIEHHAAEILAAHGLIGSDMILTIEGWRQAVACSPLERQCAHLGINHERLVGLEFEGRPERAAWEYYSRLGYSGSYCEGGALLIMIRAAALDVLEKLNPFKSRQDACRRFTEAQLTIHEGHLLEIAAAIERADADTIGRGFDEIHQSSRHALYPGLTRDTILSLFQMIGSDGLRQFMEAIAEDPYQYRSGWPDLTLTNGEELLWVEVKTTDRLLISQISTIHRMKPLMAGEIRVVQITTSRQAGRSRG